MPIISTQLLIITTSSSSMTIPSWQQNLVLSVCLLFLCVASVTIQICSPSSLRKMLVEQPTYAHRKWRSMHQGTGDSAKKRRKEKEVCKGVSSKLVIWKTNVRSGFKSKVQQIDAIIHWGLLHNNSKSVLQISCLYFVWLVRPDGAIPEGSNGFLMSHQKCIFYLHSLW